MIASVSDFYNKIQENRQDCIKYTLHVYRIYGQGKKDYHKNSDK